ncbi:molybdopterin molybdotransferase MoeA [Glutamicibacter sp. MNS18]|uniref:molybdopterin molybdotransferase MoeA n=1 Tax=Glutamicibacter sp. MNS18 TaxID=2989817 RepID=UPI00223688E1|nr:gephyrin-like molybdotransferase Glp [Glutamicibacter sp. MNS18]MCW4466910.1 molybdopterin molybdotransferase MoeA [Glutamicibacter sp. MNS18]
MTCTLETHRAEITALLDPVIARLGTQTLPVDSAELPGRVTAAEIAARLPIPAFTNSQMDGFAARSAELAAASPEHPVQLPLGLAAAAGDRQIQLLPGTVSPVMTGAVVPHGADTVIPVEATMQGAFGPLVREGEGEPSGAATFTAPSETGRFIRPVGQDLQAGAVVAGAGTRLTPTLIGALAASGVSEVPVRARLRALVCTTGNELMGGTAESGRIPDSNSPMLTAVLRGYGAAVEVLRLPDDAPALARELASQAREVDLILTVGGISAGAYEVVREALAPSGGSFHHVALQPGGPQGFALLEGTPVLCFPGNPVSALLSLELFLVPSLRRMAGLAEPVPEQYALADEVHSPAAKHQVRRGLLHDGQVTVLDPGSHLIHDLARADVLVHIPVGVAHLPAGTKVDTWRFHD